MPAKCGEYHANVYPWNSHPRNVRLNVPEKTFGMEWKDIEVPWVSSVVITRVFFERWKARAMGCAMNVGTVLDFNGLLQISNQSPEFSLHIFLSDWSVAVEIMIKWHLLLKIPLFKIIRLLLELLQGV